VAIGYGEGRLEYQILNNRGIWVFKPKYNFNKNDGLPEDAWIGFLKERTGNLSTRTNIRPFSLKEQHRILTVGACLTCHDDTSETMERAVKDFSKVIKEITQHCVVPQWN